MLAQDPLICARNAHCARYAVMSKLIAMLVSEGLASAYFFPCSMYANDDNSQEDDLKLSGICLVTTRPITIKDPVLLQPGDVYAVVPLRGPPTLEHATTVDSLGGLEYYKVELLYPLDIMLHIYGPTFKNISTAPSSGRISTNFVFAVSGAIHHHVSMIVSKIFDLQSRHDYVLSDEHSPMDLWNRFVQMYGVNEKLATDFADDFTTTITNLTYHYSHLKPLPSLQSTSIQWEQYMIDGHHFLPLSKYPLMVSGSTCSYTPDKYSSIFERPKVRLVAAPRELMDIYGDFEKMIAPVIKEILKEEARDIEERYSGYFLMPVHHMQVCDIQEKVPDVIILPEDNYVNAYGLSSIRTVALPGLLDNVTLKLTLGLKMGGAMRAIRLGHIQFATDFSQRVIPRLSYNRNILTIQPEPAGAIYKHHESDIAMHCSCIIRESIEYKTVPESNDIFIVTAALMEKVRGLDTDATLLTHVWRLDTEEKRAQFLDRYIELFLEAFVPLCRDNGAVFDTHGQNTIARFDRSTGKLKGFLVRDIDGIIMHRETLRNSCDIDFAHDSFDWAYSIEQIYGHFYSTAIDTHLQWLIRTLDMHRNGRGWEMVRTHFSKLLPLDHPMYSYLLEQKEVPAICFMRTKLKNAHTEILMPRSNLLFHDQKQNRR